MRILPYLSGLLALFSSIVWAANPAAPFSDGSVELHAHLFMKEGMSWMFTGTFDEPLHAQSWKDQFRSMANPETLDRSGIKIVVAALYAHPWLVLSLRDSIRRQIAEAEKFVATHPNWILAKSAHQARKAIESGKKVMVLSLEGASGILETEEDLKEFVDEKGIRIVTPLHLTDDHFGGVAFLRGVMVLSSPWAWLKSLFSQAPPDGIRINGSGLTEDGRRLAYSLIRHGAWIDLAHSSDLAQKELIEIMKTAGQPLLYTHTVLRKYHGAERGISEAQLHEVARTDGVIGLMPSEMYLEGTPGDPCKGGISKLALQIRESARIVPMDSIVLGSDYNGGVTHLRPWEKACDPRSPVELEGLWNIGQVGDLWSSLRRLRAPVSQPVSRTVKHFLDAWSRAETLSK